MGRFGHHARGFSVPSLLCYTSLEILQFMRWRYSIKEISWFPNFLQKFLVIILQNVSEHSHDPFDSFENDYKCPVLLSIMSDFRFIFFLSSLAIYRETNSDTSHKEFLKA